MMNKNLGRFGRLRQTLLEEGEKIIYPSNKTNDKHKKTNKTPSEPSGTVEQIELIHEWLRICTRDGHIEPSQPVCGEYLGWPIRPFFRNSLYVDLVRWCAKRGVSPNMEPSSKDFYIIANQIFHKDGDQYHFPPLSVCRERFNRYLEGRQEKISTN